MKLKNLKLWAVQKFLEAVGIKELRVKKLKVGEKTITVTGSFIDFAALTADPTLAAGRMFFRSDLGKLRYSPDGVKVVDV